MLCNVYSPHFVENDSIIFLKNVAHTRNSDVFTKNLWLIFFFWKMQILIANWYHMKLVRSIFHEVEIGIYPTFMWDMLFNNGVKFYVRLKFYRWVICCIIIWFHQPEEVTSKKNFVRTSQFLMCAHFVQDFEKS